MGGGPKGPFYFEQKYIKDDLIKTFFLSLMSYKLSQLSFFVSGFFQKKRKHPPHPSSTIKLGVGE
jgi:hypothetical protein